MNKTETELAKAKITHWIEKQWDDDMSWETFGINWKLTRAISLEAFEKNNNASAFYHFTNVLVKRVK